MIINIDGFSPRVSSELFNELSSHPIPPEMCGKPMTETVCARAGALIIHGLQLDDLFVLSPLGRSRLRVDPFEEAYELRQLVELVGLVEALELRPGPQHQPPPLGGIPDLVDGVELYRETAGGSLVYGELQHEHPGDAGPEPAPILTRFQELP